jgi:hypothetical protein
LEKNSDIKNSFSIRNPYLSTANDYYPFGMLIPSRIYSDTALTREMVYNVTSYQKVQHAEYFVADTSEWTSANGADIHHANGKMKVVTHEMDDAVYYEYGTQVGKTYKYVLRVDQGGCDSLLLRVQRLSPQALIVDLELSTGQYELTFVA